LTKQALKNIS